MFIGSLVHWFTCSLVLWGQKYF